MSACEQKVRVLVGETIEQLKQRTKEEPFGQPVATADGLPMLIEAGYRGFNPILPMSLSEPLGPTDLTQVAEQGNSSSPDCRSWMLAAYGIEVERDLTLVGSTVEVEEGSQPSTREFHGLIGGSKLILTGDRTLFLC